MSIVFLWIVTALYVMTSADLFVKGQYGAAIMFSGYSLANVGIILALSK
jgi:hypothetical protein